MSKAKPQSRNRWLIRIFWLVSIAGLTYAFTTGQVDEELYNRLLEMLGEMSQ